ncbi:hypothetical protein HELRODRAFT_161207 [Helobdella robusta]|uniref:Uncharacterized protein n=1 Tax=Helobdella robusta TaxID=6412 RepID=T1ER76_HELRO|nr:hypothetical protein HELRODRAFT_161207 [Helobdella robusta]ESO01989.1 hypothetical protein HELRODRAFT_161207 [Helobdella robusta]
MSKLCNTKLTEMQNFLKYTSGEYRNIRKQAASMAQDDQSNCLARISFTSSEIETEVMVVERGCLFILFTRRTHGFMCIIYAEYMIAIEMFDSLRIRTTEPSRRPACDNLRRLPINQPRKDGRLG